MVCDALVVRCSSCNFRTFLLLIPFLNIVLATHRVSVQNEGCTLRFSVLFFFKYSAACAWTAMKTEFTVIKWYHLALKPDFWNKKLILIAKDQNQGKQRTVYDAGQSNLEEEEQRKRGKEVKRKGIESNSPKKSRIWWGLTKRSYTSKQNLFIHQLCLHWSIKAHLNRLTNKNLKPNLTDFRPAHY